MSNDTDTFGPWPHSENPHISQVYKSIEQKRNETNNLFFRLP